MKKISFFVLSISMSIYTANAQVKTVSTTADSIYRATPTKINDLVNTKLEVSFDYQKRYLYGKEWLTLQPHFYATDSLMLDAKGMDIKTVTLVGEKNNTPLKFLYDHEFLNIQLDKKYTRDQKYTIYIAYTAKPDELKAKGSTAITDAKGLYFINPDGTDKNKPIEIWTQGETEASSAWFPTIDKPNQKTTAEIEMTVLSKYTTLSNGKLVSQKTNTDGTRTDTWKMDVPHSPYLFMMAVGPFKIYKDSWKGKEVSYYLEPKYAPFAKQIFGKTPDMIGFYSNLLGVDYPWVKYAQIVARDYVSGAMENTSATLHGESVQNTEREMLDRNGESTIAHELFHQWFGDYVTAESWSNLTMNESFATFGEVLWHGHDAGQDAEDRSRYEKLMNYLNQAKTGKSPALARFYYDDKENMFDNITYSKGSIILYALKEQLGNEAFFKGLQKYLITNAYKNGEPQQLRLAMEEVSGIDLSQYFNEWWYNGGHPVLNITYGYNNGKATIHINQAQDSSWQTFILPVKVDYYLNNKKISQSIIIDKRNQDFSFEIPTKPDFIDFDVDKTLVGEINDGKNIDDYIYQYKNVPVYANRINALKFAIKNKGVKAQQLLVLGLQDKQDDLRNMSIAALDLTDATIKNMALPILLTIAKTDKITSVRAAAINKLASTGDANYKNLMLESINKQSYNVIGAGLTGLSKLAPAEAASELLKLDTDTKEHIQPAIATVYIAYPKDEYQSYFEDQLAKATAFNRALRNMIAYINYLEKNNNPAITEKGLNNLSNTAVRLKSEAVFKKQVAPMYEKIIANKNKLAENATATDKEMLLNQIELYKKALAALNN